MAGKAPLLLAMVLFVVGAAGLALTRAEQANWGPFQPHSRAPGGTEAIAVREYGPLPPAPPALTELLSNVPAVQRSEPTTGRAPQEVAVAPSATEEPAAEEPTPTPIPPIRVFGISADDGGASAASLSPTPPPSIRIGGIAFDDTEPGTADGEPGTDEIVD